MGKDGSTSVTVQNPMREDQEGEAAAHAHSIAPLVEIAVIHRELRHAKSELVILAKEARHQVWLGLNIPQVTPPRPLLSLCVCVCVCVCVYIGIAQV